MNRPSEEAFSQRGMPCARCGAQAKPEFRGDFCAVCSLRAGLLGGDVDLGPDCLPGDFIGNWRLDILLGRGGMGVVYRAEDSATGQVVAIKLLSAALVRNEVALCRFEFEASRRFVHPGIVPVLSSVESGERPFLVMPYYAGGNLARVIDSLWRGVVRPDLSKFPGSRTGDFFRSIAEMMASIARAIEHAHERGIIHRDLKPSNILLDAEGRAYVSDFGIGRALSDDGRITASGLVLGSPEYLAPEIADGSAIETTIAGDIYGLGAILFEILTGAPPHQGGNVMETLRFASSAPTPAPRQFYAAVPPQLDIICRTCLSRDLTHRYHSARELAEDLERFSRGEAISAHLQSAGVQLAVWARRNPLPARLGAALAGALLVGFLLVTWQWNQTRRARAIAIETAEQNRQQVVRQWIDRGADALHSENVLNALPWFAAAWRSDLIAGVHSNRMALHEQRFSSAFARLPAPEGMVNLGSYITALAASSDGGWIAAGSRAGKVALWNATNPLPTTVGLSVPGAVSRLCFHSSSARLLAVSVDAKQTWHLSIFKTPSGRTELDLTVLSVVRDAAFSPDGNWLATACRNGEVVVWDSSSGAPVSPVLRHTDEVRRLAWLPNGTLLSAGWDGWVRSWNFKSGEQLAGWHSSDYIRDMVVSPDGKLLAFGGDDRTVTMVNLVTGEKGPLLSHPGWVYALAFNPDGTLLATGDNLGNIRIWDPKTGAPKSAWLGSRETGARELAFSREGSLLGLLATDRTLRVWSVKDGTPAGPPLPVGDDYRSLAWLSSGRVVVPSATGLCQTWRINGHRQADREFRVPGVVKRTSISSDEHWLAAAYEDPKATLIDLTAAQTDPVMIHHGHQIRDLVFRPGSSDLITAGHSREVRCWNPSHPMEPIWVLTLSDDPLALAFSPDGRQLATYAKNGRIQVWVWPDGVKSTIPKILFEAEIPALEAAKLRWSNDGSQLAAGVSLSDYWTPAPSPTQGVYLWRIPSGESVGSGLEIPQDVISLAFSGEGKYLAAGTQSGAARIFDTLTGRPRTPILPHSDGVSCVEFDFSGARLITGSFDQTVRVWSVPLGELLHGDLRFKGPIITVGLTQVGSSLLVASRDGTAGLWDSATFEPIIPWIRSSEPIRCAAFSPRGTMIVTGGANRRVRLTSLVFPRIELGQAEAVVAALAAFTVDQSGRCQSILPEEATAAWQRLGPIWP